MTFPPSQVELDEFFKERGGRKPSSVPASGTSEALETLLANLFIMQVMMVSKLDAIFEVLLAKGIITSEEAEAINNDVVAAIQERSSGISQVGRPDNEPSA